MARGTTHGCAGRLHVLGMGNRKGVAMNFLVPAPEVNSAQMVGSRTRVGGQQCLM